MWEVTIEFPKIIRCEINTEFMYITQNKISKSLFIQNNKIEIIRREPSA